MYLQSLSNPTTSKAPQRKQIPQELSTASTTTKTSIFIPRKRWTFIKLKGRHNGLGASKSWIFNYGWRAQQQGVLPEVYIWICKTRFKRKVKRCAYKNATAILCEHSSAADAAVVGVQDQHTTYRSATRLCYTSSRICNRPEDCRGYTGFCQAASVRSQAAA